MVRYVHIIQALFDKIRRAIAGESVVTYSRELKGMKDEFYNIDMPTIRQDKENLKQDGARVANDYRKAFEQRNKFEFNH